MCPPGSLIPIVHLGCHGSGAPEPLKTRDEKAKVADGYRTEEFREGCADHRVGLGCFAAIK